MDPAEQAAVRLVFLRLAAGEPGRLVRRRCPYPEAANDEPARRAIDALAAARLITIDAATVEVTHEALFANWPRLANWLEEDEQGRRLRAHLAPAAQEWDQTGRPEVDLYSGVRLDAALDWAGEHSADLNPVERDFLQASQDRADRELQTERARATREARARRRLRMLLIAVAVPPWQSLRRLLHSCNGRMRNNSDSRLARRLVSRHVWRLLVGSVRRLWLINRSTVRCYLPLPRPVWTTTCRPAAIC
jgi:hypothetical protein